MPEYSQQRLWHGVAVADIKDLREAISDGDLIDSELIPSSALVPMTLLAGWGVAQDIAVVDDYAALLDRTINAKSKHPDAPFAVCIGLLYQRDETPGVAFYVNLGIDDVFEAVVGRVFDERTAPAPKAVPFKVGANDDA